VDSDYYRVRLTDNAIDNLRRIGKKYGKKTYGVIRDLIRELEFEPEKKGEALRGTLHGLYSKHYSRFRIIYAVDKMEFVVVVVASGLHDSGARVDIYKALERMIESGAIVLHAGSAESAKKN